MNKELEQVTDYYKGTFQDWGHSVDALSWEDKKKQWLRFEVLSAIIPKRSCTVLDIGCGFGDLYEFFLEKKLDQITYFGIDLMPEFTAIARQRFPNVTFIDGDFHQLFEPYDVVLASGPFSIKVADNEAMIRVAMQTMWQLSTKALAFNLLSAHAPKNLRHDEYYFYDPQAMLAFARTLTPKARIRQDYLKVEFALFLER